MLGVSFNISLSFTLSYCSISSGIYFINFICHCHLIFCLIFSFSFSPIFQLPFFCLSFLCYLLTFPSLSSLTPYLLIFTLCLHISPLLLLFFSLTSLLLINSSCPFSFPHLSSLLTSIFPTLFSSVFTLSHNAFLSSSKNHCFFVRTPLEVLSP